MFLCSLIFYDGVHYYQIIHCWPFFPYFLPTFLDLSFLLFLETFYLLLLQLSIHFHYLVFWFSVVFYNILYIPLVYLIYLPIQFSQYLLWNMVFGLSFQVFFWVPRFYLHYKHFLLFLVLHNFFIVSNISIFSWSSTVVEYSSLSLLWTFCGSLISFLGFFALLLWPICCSFPGGLPFLTVYLHFLLIWLFCIFYILFG